MSEAVYDREAALERLGDDEELLAELAEAFLEEYATLLSQVQDAVAQSDPAAVGETAHTLKGCVSNFSATRAYDAALHLEKIGRSGDLESVPDALQTLETSVHELAGALKELI